VSTDAPDGNDQTQRAVDRAEAAAARAESAEREAEDAEAGAETAEARAETAEARAETAEAGAEQAQSEAEQAAQEASDTAARAADLSAAVAAAVVESEDPLIEPAVREMVAQVSEEQPFGVPGPPTSRTSPFRIGFFGGLGVLAAYGLVQSLALVHSVLILLLISGFLAVGLNPAVEFFERRGIARGRAVGIVLVIVLLAFAGFLFAVVPPIIDQTSQFIDKAPSYLDQALGNSTVKDLDSRFHVVSQAKKAVQSPDLATNAFGGVLGVGRVVFSAIFSAITVLTLTLYFMSSLPNMKKAAYRAVPRSRRARVGLLSDDILTRVGGYVAGALSIAACAGLSSFVLLFALGVQYPVALALVVLVTDLVPVIGATIGAVIVSAVAFTHDVHTGIIVAAFYLLYQQVENYLLYPRIMKRSVDVSPAVTIVAVLLGGSLLGIVGALLAIPIAAAVQLVLVEVLVPRQDAN
jgi:predicted PurR-regulated permease PerM